MSSRIEVFCIKTGPMDNNTWLVKNIDTNEGFIVDASFNANVITEKIKANAVKLKGILLTHCHYDHIYSVDELKKEFAFDGVEVYAGFDERELLSDPSLNLYKKHDLPFLGIQADVYLKDGEKSEIAGIIVKTIATPGHTRGGVCFYIESDKLLFSGDTLFAGSYGRTDLPSGSLSDIYSSITEKLFSLPDDVVVMPGHGEKTDIGYEKKTNPVLRLGE